MRKSEGPLLAVVFLAGLIVVGVLLYAAVAESGLLQGAALVILGGGLLAARREFAEVMTELSRPRWFAWNLGGTILLGAGLVLAVLVEIVQ